MDFKNKQNKESNIPIPKIENIELGEILKLKNDSNFVIREIKLEKLKDEYSGKLNQNYGATELAKLGKMLFDELRNEYGIDSPVKFFFSRDENNEAILFSVVDKIKPIIPTKEERGTVVQKFYKLYESLSHYYLDKLRNGGAFLTDINGSTQYIYGKKLAGEDKEEKIYLVDADIYLDDRQKSLLTVVYWLARHSSGIDKNSHMIENIKIFVSEYQEKFTQIGGKDKQRLIQLNKYLSEQEFGAEILPAIPTFEKKK